MDTQTQIREYNRREFLRFVAYSPLISYFGIWGCKGETQESDLLLSSPSEAKNVFDFDTLARQKLNQDAYNFLSGGADDMKTVQANRKAFDELQIRSRRLVNVSNVDTSVELFGQVMETPIMLAPIGFQQLLHPEGELAVARATAAKKHEMIVSTVSSYSVKKINEVRDTSAWFQLYPTPDRKITTQLIRKAEEAGCKVLVLTVDLPVLGNRENHLGFIRQMIAAQKVALGNFEGLPFPSQVHDPSLDWQMIEWLRANTNMKLVLKGIVTGEDARLSVENGVDGIIVSNHGGRQEESNLGTIECLPEIVNEVGGRIPVLIDGGFRRGTDIFKALALGANAICIGRPYAWGLGAFGQTGVEKVLDILRAELVRIMQLAGTTSVSQISSDFVQRNT